MKPFVLLRVSVCVLGFSACGVFAQARETIRIGTEPTYAPFEYKTPSGEIVGLDIDIGNALCNKMQVTCVWKALEYDGLIPALQARKIDAVISSLAITPERARVIGFSQPLFRTPARLVAKAGSPLLPTAKSLQGKAIGVQQATTAEVYANRYWRTAGVRVVPYQNQDQVYEDLRAGRLDATLQDEVQADVGFLKTPHGAGFAFAGPEIDDPRTIGDGAAVGLRKQDAALAARFNDAIKALKEDGTLEKLQRRYFDFSIALP